MPSNKILAEKQAQAAALTEELKGAVAGVLVKYEGITVEDDTKLRAALRKAGVVYTVKKNSMIGRACEGAGYGEMKQYLTGMNGIAYSNSDPIAAAKIMKEYADKIPTFEIKAGFIDGELLDQAGVNALAEIPNKETLVCKVMFGMQNPLYKFAYALQAIIDKSGEAPAEEAAPAEETPAAE